ncbi:mitochondrial ribosomal protein MRP51 [Dactylonectria estremocensis]|uniref:Mitochondrial ribosomal protein MRP51 n=1 Tax=Dactylonectria estremocensis TaxID=1079267 RepID=A0A9P9JFU9_9HYPO|nr:mitochondrial ribosomal protein MRP51 [Dactylonectria estremocensis]
MGGRTVSPGGALLRSSRLFSVPKPLPEPALSNLHVGNHKSPTMTRPYPQYQAITSPLSSREKGDWGFKRPLPLKTTMTTSTPLIRVKQVDAIENITDFTSAADLSLSLEKFGELGVALSIPKGTDRGPIHAQANQWQKSVFEEDMDFTVSREGRAGDKRWKFRGPWLARMSEGEFLEYLEKRVRPKRAQFRQLLKEKLAADKTAHQATIAKDQGKTAPPSVSSNDITEVEFTSYIRSLRSDRATLYGLVSKFLDLAPLGQPVGIIQTILSTGDNAAAESPYGKSGPPPSHPSGGISYLRTNSYMENHPVYGPQGRHTPVMARVVHPRGTSPAKLGVGGFVADAPAGDEFSVKFDRNRAHSNKTMLVGIQHLDTTTYGGAKAYVEPQTATIDPAGKVVLQLRQTSPESQLLAKEAQGREQVYAKPQRSAKQTHQTDSWRSNRVANEILGDATAAS